MRTTVRIADDLLDRAKELAAREDTSLAALVDEGLRLALASIIHIRVFRGSGWWGMAPAVAKGRG